MTAGVGALVAALALAAPAATRAAQDRPLDRVRWLAGCWEMRRGPRVILEMWMPPDGGMMLGASRTVSGGVVRGFEQVRLTTREGRLVYTALPSGQREASFTSVEVSDSGFTVENAAHDFPRRITYRRRGTDSLVARVESPPPEARGFDIPMRRVACTSP